MIHHRRTKRRLRKLYRQSRRNCRGGATNKASKQRNDTLRIRTAIRRESQIKDSVNTLRRFIAERRTAAKEKRLIEKLESKSLPPAEHNEMIELIRQKSQTLTPRLSPKCGIREKRGKIHIKENPRLETRAESCINREIERRKKTRKRRVERQKAEAAAEEAAAEEAAAAAAEEAAAAAAEEAVAAAEAPRVAEKVVTAAALGRTQTSNLKNPYRIGGPNKVVTRSKSRISSMQPPAVKTKKFLNFDGI